MIRNIIDLVMETIIYDISTHEVVESVGQAGEDFNAQTVDEAIEGRADSDCIVGRERKVAFNGGVCDTFLIGCFLVVDPMHKDHLVIELEIHREGVEVPFSRVMVGDDGGAEGVVAGSSH